MFPRILLSGILVITITLYDIVDLLIGHNGNRKTVNMRSKNQNLSRRKSKVQRQRKIKNTKIKGTGIGNSYRKKSEDIELSDDGDTMEGDIDSME